MTPPLEADQGPDDSADAMPSADSEDGADWRTDLDQDTRSWSRKFTSLGAQVQSHRDLERHLGKAVVPPAADAKPEEIEDYYRRLGRPAEPGDYELSLPDGREPTEADQAFHSEMQGLFHGAGLTNAQARALNEGWNKYVAGVSETSEQAARSNQLATEAGLRRDWGADYDRNLGLAQRAAAQFGGEAFIKFVEEQQVDGRPVGDHPAFLKAFAAVGQRMGEDGLLTAGSDGHGAGDVQARIDAIISDHFGKPSYNSPAVQGQLRELHVKAYGTEPADGRLE